MNHLKRYFDFINESLSPQDLGDGILGFPSVRDNQDKELRKEQLGELIKNIEEAKKLAISHYENWFKDEGTLNKFENKNNVNEVLKIVRGIKIVLVSNDVRESDSLLAFVVCPFVDTDLKDNVIRKYSCLDKSTYDKIKEKFKKMNKTFPWQSWINVYFMYEDKSSKIKTMTVDDIKEILVHEIGHLIDYKLSQLGEESLANFYQKESDEDDEWGEGSGWDWDGSEYVKKPTENFARLQNLRQYLNLKPVETPESIIDKLLLKFKDKSLSILCGGVEYSGTNTIASPILLDWFDHPNLFKVSDDKKSLIIKTGVVKKPEGYKSDIEVFNFRDNMTQGQIGSTFAITAENEPGSNKNKKDFTLLFANNSHIEGKDLIIDFVKICNLNNRFVETGKEDKKLAPDPLKDKGDKEIAA